MDITSLLNSLKSPIQEITLSNGTKLNIRRPGISKLSECVNATNTVLNCVVDAESNQVFKPEDIEQIDPLLVNEIFVECMKLFPSDSNPVEQIEKK
ncbi:hypothetical protein E0U70_20140 [Salmonella enterica subsp. enterica serovar Gloucester]|nr:hypothetical protein [Salmonella enterica subsp. enterica serovar Gloucester]